MFLFIIINFCLNEYFNLYSDQYEILLIILNSVGQNFMLSWFKLTIKN